MPKKPKQIPTKTKLEKECFTLWSKCARARQRTCRICGADSSSVLQSHHIRSRVNVATRFDLENALVLCSRCHCLQRFKPETFFDNVIECIGQEEYDRLKAKSAVIAKQTVQDLIEMKEHLTRTLKHIEDYYGVFGFADQYL